MTFSEIYNAVVEQFGDTSDTMKTKAKRYVNWTQQDAASRFDWPFLMGTANFTTADGTATYSANAAAEKIIDIRNTSKDMKLYKLSRQEFDAKIPDPTSEGSPELWIDAGSSSNILQIQFYPIPDAIYTLPYWYRKRLTDMTLDADISEIPLKYHKLLYLGGLAQCYEYDENPMANNMWAQYENMLGEMQTELMGGSEDEIPVLRSVDELHINTVSDLRLPPDHFEI